MSEQGQVKIGREFFSKIKLDYRDWRFALIREFLQNGFDAPGCGAVEIEVTRDGADTRLVVRNDGAPMSRDVLVNKLLTLGGSGKNFEGGVGGFGVAKSLLYYTHVGYVIRTGPLTVSGAGAQYSIAEGGSCAGTESTVTIEGDEVEALAAMVRRFASLAQWGGRLTLNGEPVATDLRKGSRRRDLGWGVVYTNNSHANLCVVRLNGQPMFTQYTRHRGCVLIELNGKSSDILTSNRDGLKGRWASELSDLLTALAVDKRTALKEQRAEYRRYQGERQRHEARQPKAAEQGLAAFLGAKQLEKLAGLPSGGKPGNATPTGPTGEPIADAAPPTAGGGGIRVVVEGREDEPDKSITLGPEFITKNCSGMKIPVSYTPGERFSQGNRDLVGAWCGILIRLHRLLNVSGDFSVGFVFDDETEAECEQSSAYGRVYYLNPVTIPAEGKRRMEARYKSAWHDRHALISLAAHELVHGAYGLKQHDEDYASRLTDVMTVCLREIKELEEACRPAKDEAALPRTLQRQEIMGHPMTAVMRWMGADGWSFEQARDTLAALGCDLNEGTLRIQLRAGIKGERGDPAPLTDDQADELRDKSAQYR